MRWLLTVFTFVGAAMTLHADTFLYVSMAPEQKIQIYHLNSKDGKLTAVDSVAVDGSPGCLAVDPQKKYLFASLRSTSKLASFSIDPANGKLKPISTVPLGKGRECCLCEHGSHRPLADLGFLRGREYRRARHRR